MLRICLWNLPAHICITTPRSASDSVIIRHLESGAVCQHRLTKSSLHWHMLVCNPAVLTPKHKLRVTTFSSQQLHIILAASVYLRFSKAPPHQPPSLPLQQCLFACRQRSHRQCAPVKRLIPSPVHECYCKSISLVGGGRLCLGLTVGDGGFQTGKLSQPVVFPFQRGRISAMRPPGCVAMNSSHPLYL